MNGEETLEEGFTELPEEETGEITSQLAMQKNKIDKLTKAVAELEQRLQPVLAADAPEKNEGEPDKEVLQAALSEAVRKNSDSISMLIERVRGINLRVRI